MRTARGYRPSLPLLTLALALFFTAPALAQIRTGRIVPLPASATVAPVHPALLSPEGYTGGPLTGLLAQGAMNISAAVHAPTPVAEPAAAVLHAMAAGDPAERVAASVLARALSNTRDAAALLLRVPSLAESDLPSLAGRRTPLGSAAQLAEAAHDDPSISFLFDGRAAGSIATPEGAVLEGEDLLWQGEHTAALGRGFFGIVHPHPAVEGAVIKTDLPRKLSILGEPPSMGQWRIGRDRKTADDAATIGVGPRVLGEGTISGHPALVKERIYGDTVEKILENDAFGAEEHELLEELFLTIARSGISFVDVRPGNVMIGRTLVDPILRAYLVDGGESFTPKATATAVEAMEKLFGVLRGLTHQSELLKRFDAIHFARPLPPEHPGNTP